MQKIAEIFLPNEDQTDVIAAFHPIPMKNRCVAFFASLLLIGWPTAAVHTGKPKASV